VARSNFGLAAIYARRKANRDLPGDIFGRDLQDLRRLFSGSRRRDRLSGHGAWRQVKVAMAARDVPAGESWVFPGHRTMAEVIADETVAA